MKVIQLEETPEVRGLEHRGGTFHARTIVEGTPGTPGNFKFSLSRLGTDYSGPRHRHNFDQYRYMIEGSSDYGQDGPLKAGMLGYYPEGVPYGPQVNKTEIYCAVLQFGGASGSGYLLPREVKAGMEELKAFGEFKDGIFHRRDGVPGKRNMDAYQAIWEHVHGRESTPRAVTRRRSRSIPRISIGSRSKARAVCRRSCSVCGPSAVRRPACSGSTTARGSRLSATASIWCSQVPAAAPVSGSSNTRRSMSRLPSAPRSRPAKRPCCCTMACPISPASKPWATPQARCRRQNSRRQNQPIAVILRCEHAAILAACEPRRMYGPGRRPSRLTRLKKPRERLRVTDLGCLLCSKTGVRPFLVDMQGSPPYILVAVSCAAGPPRAFSTTA